MSNTSKTNKITKFSIKDIKEAYKLLETNEPMVEKVLMRPDYFKALKKETKPIEKIGDIYGIPVIVDPNLNVPYKFIYKKEICKNCQHEHIRHTALSGCLGRQQDYAYNSCNCPVYEEENA